MGVRDCRQVQIERGGSVAVGGVGQVEGDGARVGRQWAGGVLPAPGFEERKGRLVNAPGVFGAPRVTVGASLVAEARLQSGDRLDVERPLKSVH
jgi:hypothetical protein